MVRVDFTIELADRPGELLKVLSFIVRNQGNVVSVVHERDKARGEYVPVSLSVDFPSDEGFKRVKEELERAGTPILKSEKITEKAGITLLIVGRFNIDAVRSLEAEGVKVLGLEATLPLSKEPCIKLSLEIPAGSALKVLERINSVVKQSGGLLIPPIEVA